MVMPISDKEYIADLGECMTKLEADLAALREENARLRQRVEECEREHPPEPEYTAWWEAGKPDVTKLRQRVEEERQSKEAYFKAGREAEIEVAALRQRVEELERQQGTLVKLGQFIGDKLDDAWKERAEAAEAKLKIAEVGLAELQRSYDFMSGEAYKREQAEAKLARCVEALELLLLPIRPLLSDEPHERRIPTQHDVLVIRQARAALAATKGGE